MLYLKFKISSNPQISYESLKTLVWIQYSRLFANDNVQAILK